MLQKLFLIAIALVMAGCASTSISGRGERNEIDPFEFYNRAIFGFNDAADTLILKPAANIYVKATPELAKFLIGNFFSNLNEVNNGVNNLLQGKPKAALIDATRFTINTLFGMGGLADLATDLGLERSNEDFGQTLGKWGIAPGPYLMVPLVGPTSARDLAGRFVDYPLYPLNRLKPNGDRVALNIVNLIDQRAAFLDASQAIDGAALDRYTFIRNGYFQRRLSLVYDGNPPLPKDSYDDDELKSGAPEAKPAADKPAAAKPAAAKPAADKSITDKPAADKPVPSSK